MDTNLNVLDEINKGCSMGIEAIDMILKKNDEYGFHDLNVEFYDKYVELSDKIIKLYHEYTEEEIHKANTMEKMMTWYGIMKDTLLDDSVSKLAELLLNGTVMGIIEGNKILNHKKMDKKVKSICEEYLHLQDKYYEKLKRYL
ncbi:MAG: hypothetical protein IKF71_02185 [Bacilli bacterium]|nr:hypothetical protein [Bacilli bacterium]